MRYTYHPYHDRFYVLLHIWWLPCFPFQEAGFIYTYMLEYLTTPSDYLRRALHCISRLFEVRVDLYLYHGYGTRQHGLLCRARMIVTLKNGGLVF